MLENQCIKEFLDDLSIRSVIPGGGSASGITAAVSAALIAMVCNMTIGKKKYRHVEDELAKMLENVDKLRKEFLLLSDKYTEVIEEKSRVHALPRNTEEEIAERKKNLDEISKKASLVPMEVIRRCENLAQCSRTLAMKGNELALSDVGMAALLARSAAQGASLNILVNLAYISDEDFIGKLKTEQAKVLKLIEDIGEETLQIVKSKL